MHAREVNVKKRITMKEIARLAKVSQATVSRVINGNPDVNEELAARVLKVIEEVGYVPNQTAQTLKRNQSKLIGVSVSEMYNPYFVELVDHLEDKARKLGYNIILHNSKHNPILEWENIQNFMTRQIDGCVIVPAGNHNLERLGKLPIPVVSITQTVEQLDSVAIDHFKAGKLAASSFIRAGHTSFAYIGKADDEKFLGFASGLYEHHLPVSAARVLELEQTSDDHFLVRQRIEKHFRTFDEFPFTCVFTENDIIALECIKLVEERGLKVPEDISVIGFDDTLLSKIMGISSIHQPIEEMVGTTLELLINRMEGKLSPDIVSIQLEPTLITRRSSNHRRI